MARPSRGLRLVALLVALLAPLAASAAPATEEARATVQGVVDQVLAVLRDPALASAERRSRIEAIAFDWFDFETMSKLVVARRWRSFTPEQKKTFVTEFRELLAARYGRKLDSYGKEDVAVGEARQDAGGDVTVRTRILRPGADEVSVDYRLRSEGGRWRAIDVVIEGVSLVFSYRGQFQDILAAKGPDGLIERVRQKNVGPTD
jgi:phospholipid transport system substrate-binding protein